MKRFLIYFSLTLSALLASGPPELSAHVQNGWTGALPSQPCWHSRATDLNSQPAVLAFMIKASSSGSEQHSTIVEDAEFEREEDEVGASKKHVEFSHGYVVSILNTDQHFSPSIKDGLVLNTRHSSLLPNQSYLLFRTFRI